MSTEIKDGTGSGNIAKVNNSKRLVTESVTSELSTVKLLQGKSFSLPSGVIDVTNTTEIPLLYFSHSEINEELRGYKMILWSSESTGGTESTMLLNFYLKATGMTGGNDFTPVAAAIGSTRLLDGTFIKGALGATLDGGDLVTSHIVKIGEPYILDFNALYAKDKSLGVTITPPSGNTSMKVSYIINTELITLNDY